MASRHSFEASLPCWCSPSCSYGLRPAFGQTKSRITSVNPDLWLKRSLGHPRDANQIHLLKLHPTLTNSPLWVSKLVYRNRLVSLVKAETIRYEMVTNNQLVQVLTNPFRDFVGKLTLGYWSRVLFPVSYSDL